MSSYYRDADGVLEKVAAFTHQELNVFSNYRMCSLTIECVLLL